jgi:hypothetical protein
VFVEVEWWDEKKVNEFSINTYSSKAITLEEIDANLHPNYLQDILTSCARESSNRKNYKEKGGDDIFRCLSITDSKCEYGFLYYENNT